MKRLLSLLSVASILGLFSLTSCVSTDTMEPEIKSDSSKKLILNFSTPEALTTRATDGYKLRLSAKLYSGSLSNLDGRIEKREELIYGEKGNGDVVNQVVFDVPTGYNYSILVFADYIPSSFQPDASGRYNDYFYDTSRYKDAVTMLATPGNKNTEDADITFFNNDNYDCFSAKQYLEIKNAEEVVFNLELKRAVAKVRLVDNSKNSGDYDLKINNINYLKSFNLINDRGGYNSVKSSKALTLFTQKSFTGVDEQELAFFYTFASESTTAVEYPQVTLTIDDQNGNNNSLQAKNIDVKRNYITTVKGGFLPDSNPKDDPGTGDNTKEGPIYVNMAISTDSWQNQTSSWSN